MTEAQLFEKIGRLQAALDEATVTRQQLIGVVAQIVDGTLDVNRVMVNVTDQQVSWSAEGERPALPMQINGLPHVVVAPDGPAPGEDKPCVKVKLWQSNSADPTVHEPVTVVGQFAVVPGHDVE